MTRNALIFMLVLSSFVVVGCGDDGGGSIEVPGTLGALNADQKAALCESVMAQSPQECWEEDNTIWVTDANAAGMSDDVAACVDALDAFNPQAAPSDVLACYAALDTDCDFTTADACSALIPENIHI